MDEWDPIGVAGIPEAADEYDSYMGVVGRKLREGATADQIAAYLTDISEEYMGLGPSAAAASMTKPLPVSSWPGTATLGRLRRTVGVERVVRR